MATISSFMFTVDENVRNRLQKCADDHAFNIYQGKDGQGEHVAKIQLALTKLVKDPVIAAGELSSKLYGPSTAAAVEKFKRDGAINGTGRMILGAGQNAPDRIVGIQTIAALDAKIQRFELGLDDPKPKPSPAPGPGPIPGGGSGRTFQFLPAVMPLLIKEMRESSFDDLEDAPVKRAWPTNRARALASRITPPFEPPTADRCIRNLIDRISHGGAEARELATFFLTNRQRNLTRRFGPDHFWSKRVRGDSSFTNNHARLTQAIQAGLQTLADLSTPSGVIDVNRLAKGPSQPAKLDTFATDISFSFKKEPKRAATGDPLAFGIGDVQGLQTFITALVGQPNGSYTGNLTYILIDHFGSNDGDLYDQGQAGLWLLQRKMADGQHTMGFTPYRVEITVDNVAFSGQLK